MNINDLYDTLHQVGFKNPEYIPAQGHSTFIVIELAENPDSVHFASTIVDPGMPEKGGPEDYLHLHDMQRTALELSRIAHIIIDNVSGVAIHGPKNRQLREQLGNNMHHIAHALSHISRKAAISALELSLQPPEGHA